jgi:hypothetical protein
MREKGLRAYICRNILRLCGVGQEGQSSLPRLKNFLSKIDKRFSGRDCVGLRQTSHGNPVYTSASLLHLALWGVSILPSITTTSSS